MGYIIGDKFLNKKKDNKISYIKITDKQNNQYSVEFSENGEEWFELPWELDEAILDKYWNKI